LTKKGDVVSVRCKVHGNRRLIVGVDIPLETEAGITNESGTPPDCPYCQQVATGPLMCGTGWIDQRGVQFIVDEQGRIRHFEKLTEVQAERIREGKKNVVAFIEKLERDRREKK
jgi:hypothetical protein